MENFLLHSHFFFLTILFSSLRKSPLLSPGPSSLICQLSFFHYLFLSFSQSPFISLTGFSFSVCLSLRIFFILKSHFFPTLHGKSVLLEMCCIMTHLWLILRLKVTYCRDGKTEFSLCYVHCFLSLFLWQQPCYPLLARPMEVKP